MILTYLEIVVKVFSSTPPLLVFSLSSSIYVHDELENDKTGTGKVKFSSIFKSFLLCYNQ